MNLSVGASSCARLPKSPSPPPSGLPATLVGLGQITGGPNPMLLPSRAPAPVRASPLLLHPGGTDARRNNQRDGRGRWRQVSAPLQFIASFPPLPVRSPYIFSARLPFLLFPSGTVQYGMLRLPHGGRPVPTEGQGAPRGHIRSPRIFVLLFYPSGLENCHSPSLAFRHYAPIERPFPGPTSKP